MNAGGVEHHQCEAAGVEGGDSKEAAPGLFLEEEDGAAAGGSKGGHVEPIRRGSDRKNSRTYQ